MENYEVTAELMMMGHHHNCTSLKDAVAIAKKLLAMGAANVRINGEEVNGGEEK